MRRPGDEVQLTNVIAALGASDTGFAVNFAKAVLAQAREDCPHCGAAHARLGPVPDDLMMDRERNLYDEDEGASRGRIDLILEDPSGSFTLLVENKLYAEYGRRQLDNYHQALVRLSKRGQRCGLVAITRDLPPRRELEPKDRQLARIDPRPVRLGAAGVHAVVREPYAGLA